MSKKVGFKVRVHTFRHTFATILISKGIDVVSVAAILGNTPKMALQVYAHVIENRNAELTNIINQAKKIAYNGENLGERHLESAANTAISIVLKV